MRNKLGKVLSWIFISILLFIAIVIGIVFVQTKMNPDKIPAIFGYKPFIVLSGSMETEIYKGDLVIVKNTDVKSLKKNDVIAFRDDENYVVTHRIVEVINDEGEIKFITKGDNNNINDADYVRESDVEGVYKFKISGFGTVLLVMQKPVTLIFTLIIIVGFGVLYIVFDNGRMSAADKKELEELRKKQKYIDN